MTSERMDFGFYPHELEISAGPVTVRTSSDLEQIVGQVLGSEGVENDWIYAPPQEVRDFMSGQIRELPYSSRVFGLPKTHTIEHTAAESRDQLSFHLWSLSFFTGSRLTATEAGFVDATPLKPGRLVDFVLMGRSLVRSLELAEAFWITNSAEPRRARRLAAAVHALFLGQSSRNLQFESFVFLYMALDACYALTASLKPPRHRVHHKDRIAWMCQLLGIALPAWADPAVNPGTEIATIRNDTLHEALFMDAPLGFAVHEHRLTAEMPALICRLIVALIGGETSEYVRTPVNTRQCHGLNL